MASMIDYLGWRGDIEFCEKAINVVDVMILCELIYYRLDGIVPESFETHVKLGEACREDVLDPLPNYCSEEDLRLCKLIQKSPRIAEIEAGGFINRISEKDNMQFCAMTCFLDEDLNAVIFRGTDDSLIGWKENMDLAYSETVPSQTQALQYLKTVAGMTKGKLIVAGHSKGGNLAVYSSAFADEEIQKRIAVVYNFDGPGFNDQVIRQENFARIAPRTQTYVPQDSIIGLLLEHRENIAVIHSSEGSGFSQHNLCTWSVMRDSVIREEKITKSGEANRDSLREWISSMSYEEKRQFIKAAYDLVDEYKTTEDLFTIKNIWKVIQAYRSMTEEEKKPVSVALSELKNAVIENIKGRFIKKNSEGEVQLQNRTV